jgi:hypothetical protein
VLVAWQRNFARVALFLVRARPLPDRPGFLEVLDRARVTRPRVVAFGPERGRFPNAFAFPGCEPAVAFSRPLLAELTPEETKAVFAHEVAHLEDFDAATLRRLRAQETAVVLLACGAGPALARFGAGGALWAWMLAVLVYLVRRARAMQEKETEADRRALELGADPEALVAGLTKLHATAHVPRRLAAEAERVQTHPSLARRIRAIRGDDVPTDAGWRESLVAADDARESVALDAERVTWTTHGADGSVEAERSLAYPALVELRLVVKGGRRELRAVAASGARTRLAVQADDVARLQAALDRVDGKLAPAKSLRTPGQGGGVFAALTGLCAFLGLTLGVVTLGGCLLLLVAGVAAMRGRSRAWLAAAGAMALAAGAAHTLALGGLRAWTTQMHATLFALNVAGLACLMQARKHADMPAGAARHVATFLGVCGAAFLALPLVAGGGSYLLLRLSSFAHASPAPFVALAGAGAALWTARRRVPAALLLALGLAHVPLGSETFLVHAAGDRLAAALPAPRTRDAEYRVLREARVTGLPEGLQLAPGGERFAARLGVDESGAGMFLVAGFDGAAPVPVHAYDLVFADTELVLALAPDGGSVQLQARSAARPGEVAWRRTLPGLAFADGPELTARDGRWRVVAGRYGERMVSLEGRIGDESVTRREWSQDGAGARFVGAGRRTLRVGWAPVTVGAAGAWQRVACALGGYTPVFTLSADDTPLGATTCWLEGADAPPGGTRALAVTNGIARVGRVWSFDTRTGTLTPRFSVGAHRGWRWDGTTLAVVQPSHLLVVDVARERGVRIPLPPEAMGRCGVALADDAVALAWAEGESVRVTLLALPPRAVEASPR